MALPMGFPPSGATITLEGSSQSCSEQLPCKFILFEQHMTQDKETCGLKKRNTALKAHNGAHCQSDQCSLPALVKTAFLLFSLYQEQE